MRRIICPIIIGLFKNTALEKNGAVFIFMV